ncbi:MAG: ribose-phosphate pyrophosphokinase, partial [Methylobacter sp.]
LRLFALSESHALGESIGADLCLPLSAHEERDFEDGEHKTRPLENVRGCDVFVIQSLYSEPGKSVNDKLCRLLFFIGALKDASARSVTAVLPYLGYARKDRKTKARDPVTTRYVAQLLESVGTDRVVTLDVHNLAAFQNAFRCSTDHLEAKNLFVEHFAARVRDIELVVVSPDIGGVKRAEQFREALSLRLNRPAGSAFMEKQRSAGIVSGEALVGDVKGKAAIIIDDMISTGGTISRTANACRNQGAQSVHAAASHGIFVGKADQVVADPALDSLVVTNTLPPFRLDPELVRNRLTVLDAAPLFADAIQRIHNGRSIVDLLGEE